MRQLGFIIGVVLTTLILHATGASAAPLTSTTKFDLGGREPVGYKRAVTQQSRTVSADWGTGLVTFGRGGVPVFYAPIAQVQIVCHNPLAIACHGNNGTQLYIIVSDNIDVEDEQYALDHEIVETMVDPYPYTDPTLVNGDYAEVCDPSERVVWFGTYALASWVGPDYYTNGATQ